MVDHVRILGVVNVTPDSFSDGGLYATTDAAVARGIELVEQGADIIDVGGESTRPGAGRVTGAEAQRRVLPVVTELCARGIVVSVDTMDAQTAAAAAAAGASYVNDVSGGLADPAMTSTMIDLDLPWVVMHWRGHSATMNSHANYQSAAEEVCGELHTRVDELVRLGANRERLIIDPGLGFAKKSVHNWEVLGHLDLFLALGLPVVIGASRKRFIGRLLGENSSVSERDTATSVISALAALTGVWGVRVHDVASTRAALDVAEAWQSGARS